MIEFVVVVTDIGVVLGRVVTGKRKRSTEVNARQWNHFANTKGQEGKECCKSSLLRTLDYPWSGNQ